MNKLFLKAVAALLSITCMNNVLAASFNETPYSLYENFKYYEYEVKEDIDD